ncbi:HAD family hydrolase [Pedobacter sp. BMA]|uniref:HAD family hydrolase n=1 Tax=Pedobacter sp. BMA TaxID=1663685 RepID=UPI000649941C|nr:HAD family hydrolase [Pedobacter sp. BMA]KLT65496.1 dehalogenase [Pedobacter sp. BMA]
MAFYKHYSFDLWLTLIKSNPTFKLERSRYFFEKFNSKNKTIEEVSSIVRRVDLMVNAMNEKTGKNVDADEMHLIVISMINDYNFSFSEINLEQIYADIEALFFEFMPLVYCENCLPVLAKIQDSRSSTVNILSNTGFIRGHTLRQVIQQLGIAPFIDFQLYSDEVRMSKPSAGFFQLMLNGICRKTHPDLQLSDVMHVGDNPVADVLGAKNIGINSMLINSNKQSILTLLS